MNRMYFNKEGRDLMMKFIENLCDMSYYVESDMYNDIHIRPEDGGAFSVEWSQESWKYIHDRGGFQYVGADDEICALFEFPDGHSDYVPVGDEKAYLDDWLKENPGWEKDEFGEWHKKNEAEELMRLLGKKPRFTFTAVDSSTGEPILNGVHLDDDNIVNPKVRKDLGLDTENYEPKKSEHFDFDVSKCAEQEDELRNDTDQKNFETVSLKNIDWATPATTTEAKDVDIDFDRLAEPEYLKTIVGPELGFTEPYKYNVGDD